MYEGGQLMMMCGCPAGEVGGRVVTASLYSIAVREGSGSGSVDEPEEGGDVGFGWSEVVATMAMRCSVM